MRALATGGSAFTTFVQVVPRLPMLVRCMRPTWHLASLAELDAAFVRTHGIRGIVWDVDGTLTGDRRATLVPEAEGPFRLLLALDGLRHAILSNAGEERFRQLSEMFPDVPVLRGYALRGEMLYRRRRGAEDSWTDAELESRLAEGAHVIRKPSAELVACAVRELGCASTEAVMVGDQFLTDVAGANLGGIRSVKLPTLAPETFRASVRLSQRLENVLYAVLYGRARA